MKFYLFLLPAMLGLSLKINAQTKILDIADKTRRDSLTFSLYRKYKPIYNVFSERPLEAQNVTMVSNKQFLTFQRANGFNRLKVAFSITEFYEPTGEAAYAVLQWLNTTPPDTTRQQVIKLLMNYYQTKQVKTKANVRFSLSIMYSGNLAEARKARTAPGAINTLEAARRTTRPDTVKTLYFNSLELDQIPEVVYRFPNLIELDLSRNNLKTVPARLTVDLPKLERLSLLHNALVNDSVFFASNKHLKALNLQGNELTLLPASVRQNRRLESLWLGNNTLKTADFRGLRRLTDLNIYNAELTACPPSVAKLSRLKVLDLYYNYITELPARLSRLRRLEQLAVSHNKLKQLPEQLARLRRLQVLYAHHNEIGTLPDRFDRFRSLRLLDLGYNFFSTTPLVLDRLVTLEELDLNSNNLQELSPGLLNLSNLKKLYLRNNPITAGQGRVGSFTQTIQQLEARKTEVFH